MKLHDLLKQVSDILDPDGGVFNYFLHTFDDNGGFLRTRHQWWEQEVEDKEIPDLRRVLLCFVDELDVDGAFYTIEWVDIVADESILDLNTVDGESTMAHMSTACRTLVKLELYYDMDDDDYIQSTALSAYENGYKYAYVVDLTTKTYAVDTFPVIKHQNLVVVDLGSGGDLFYGGTYFDDQGVRYDLKSTINRGTFTDTVLITVNDPEIDAFQSFVCRYRLRGSGGVAFYHNKHDLLIRDNCSLLIVNDSAAELTVSVAGIDYSIPADDMCLVENIEWGGYDWGPPVGEEEF